MNTENAILMKMARESLQDRWALAIGVFFLNIIITTAVQFIPYLGTLVSIAISGPLLLGLSLFILSISRDEEAYLEQLFEGFKNAGTATAANIITGVIIMIGLVLLIIPGIIAALSLSMTFYIIADDDSIGVLDAIKKSNEMMKDHRWKLFYLYLRFFGWGIVCLLTLGLGFLWLIPYIQVSVAKFYEDIKDNNELNVEFA
jgi:uncharacterized membrane protein